MKAAFALLLVLVLFVAALHTDAKPMNLQGRRLADASIGRKGSAGSSEATFSSTSTAATTSGKTNIPASTTGTSSTPTTATATGTADAKTGPQREKNDGYDNYASTPADSDNDSSHHVITGPF